MPKRKRENDPAPSGTTGEPSAKQQRLQYKLHHATKQVAHAYKVAKGFERQKLSRRQKKAQEEGDSKDVERIEAEIAALKALDLPSIAHFYFVKTLSKNKNIVKSDQFNGLLDIPSVQIEGSSRNVVARLCNAVPVKTALQDGHDDIIHAAGIPSLKLSRKDKGRVRKVNERQGKEPAELASDIDESESQEDTRDGEVPAGNGQALRWEVDDVSDVSSGADDIAAIEQQLLSEGVKHKRQQPPASQVDHPLGEEESSLEDDSDDRPTLKKAKGRPTASTILPSLTMGGYISGSDDSEIEDIDGAARKNRPGQRARQAIWEKKYGTKAKHLQKTGKSRDQGWDPKRGATASGERSAGRSQTGKAAFDRKPQQVKPKRDDSGPLHPSWEAAKQAKAKNVGIPAFAGKKISFE